MNKTEIPPGVPARMPGVFETGVHHKPGEVHAGVWYAVCGAPCFWWDSVRQVRAYYVPCPDCPPDDV